MDEMTGPDGRFEQAHTRADRRLDTGLFESLAARYGLLKTGGTDFHGAIKKGLQLGTGYGNFCVPYALFEPLNERLPQ